ncbi:MAG: hypothetical protein ACPGSD_05070 [Flavobacteriales bacterium]
MTGLLHAHHYFSYLVVAIIVFALIKSVMGLTSKTLGKSDLKISLFALIFTHIQALVGIIMFGSHMSNMGEYMSDSALRLRYVEHPMMMIIVAVLVTIANSKSKKSTDAAKTQKTRVILYGLSVLFIVLRVLPLWM